MAGRSKGNAYCDRCGERLDQLPAPFPGGHPPCPKCGSTDRKIVLSNGTLHFGSWISAPREVVRKHPGWTAALVTAIVGSVVIGPLLGLIWGTVGTVALTAVAFVAGERWKVRGRDVER